MLRMKDEQKKNASDKLLAWTDKLDNFLFDEKVLNRIIAGFVAFFVLMFAICCSLASKKLDEQNDTYAKMLAELEARQLNEIYQNMTPNDGITTDKQNESPMFKNAIEASVFAFEKFNTYSTYEVELCGSSTAVAVGQTVEIAINGKNVQYDDGTQFSEMIHKETKTNFGQTEATQIVYKNGQKYMRYGSNIREQNGKYVADFAGRFSLFSSNIAKITSYIVNKKTALYSKEFSFVRNADGTIAYYKATVVLDAKASTVDYAKSVQEQGGTSLPEFSMVEIACIIDRDGNLLSYNAKDKMTLTKNIVVDITTTMTDDMTFIILSHDTTPSVPKPNV